MQIAVQLLMSSTSIQEEKEGKLDMLQLKLGQFQQRMDDLSDEVSSSRKNRICQGENVSFRW